MFTKVTSQRPSSPSRRPTGWSAKAFDRKTVRPLGRRMWPCLVTKKNVIVERVPQLGERFRIAARRGLVDLCRSLQLKRLMRALLVEFSAETVESFLLLECVLPSRARRFGLQRPMHSL